MLRDIVIKSFNGIGDLLYSTPSLRVIKEAYPKRRIVFNTNYPKVLECNPFVDEIGTRKDGVFLGYPDIIHRRPPAFHHVINDWKIICDEYKLKTNRPKLRPEVYFPLYRKLTRKKFSFRDQKVLVQSITKKTFSGKKIWPRLQKLVEEYDYTPIPYITAIQDLFRLIAIADVVVCIEGGLHNIAAAVGTPAVVILGGLHDPAWTTYPGQITITRDCNNSLECYNPDPCKASPEKWCMQDISLDEVHKAVENILYKENGETSKDVRG